MSNFKLPTTVLALMLSGVAGTAGAQSLSGTLTFSGTSVNSVSPDGSVGINPLYADYTVTDLMIDLDWTTASGLSFGTNIISATGSVAGLTDAYNSGEQIDLRVGKDFGSFNGELFIGYLDAVGEDSGDNSIRSFGGFAGAFSLSNGTTVTAQIGYLDGTDGTDDSGFDGMSAAVFGGVGVLYDITGTLSIGLDISGASGIMDDDIPRDEAAIVADTQLSLHYSPAAAPAWDLFATAGYTSYFQGGEDDTVVDTTFGIGASYSFGSGRSSAKPLPLARWVAITAGVLE